MTRKLEALGLALAAVLAAGALSATAASAASFHSEAAHTILTGEQSAGTDEVFAFNAGSVICKNASYSGTTSSATTATVTVVPSYGACTAFGFVNAAIDVPAGCTFTFDASGPFYISCSGSPMTITAFNCHIRVGTASFSKMGTYDNAGSKTSRDVTITINFGGLRYTQESKSFPGCSNGTFTNGTYKSSITLRGANTTGTSVGIWHS